MSEDFSDPFDPSVTPGVQMIIQMRIYDVLMAIYTSIDKEGAAQLYNLHAQGKVMGTLPWIDLSSDDANESLQD